MPESRLTTSIRDRITTIRERLDNHQKASESLELVTAEIDKTEQQITHLCEVGMTMSDSAGLSVQIDSISAIAPVLRENLRRSLLLTDFRRRTRAAVALRHARTAFP